MSKLAYGQSDGTVSLPPQEPRNARKPPMSLARLNRRILSVFVLCLTSVCVTSIPGKVNAGTATRLRPQKSANHEVTDTGPGSNTYSIAPIKNSPDRATRIAELSGRLAELEGPAKLENPGIAIDDASLRVDPMTQPVLN